MTNFSILNAVTAVISTKWLVQGYTQYRLTCDFVFSVCAIHCFSVLLLPKALSKNTQIYIHLSSFNRSACLRELLNLRVSRRSHWRCCYRWSAPEIAFAARRVLTAPKCPSVALRVVYWHSAVTRRSTQLHLIKLSKATVTQAAGSEISKEACEKLREWYQRKPVLNI